MKHLMLLMMLATYCSTFSQSDTEIHLFDFSYTNNKINLKSHKNISQNKGYDNQPSFFDERYILFASTRNEQTDIAKYDTRYNAKSWLNYTDGGEYTPLKVPQRNAVSAVRLDKDGTQRLYKYMWSNGESEELIKNLVVAYYTWYDNNTIVSAVIEDDILNLYVSDIKSGRNTKYADNVGRSFHKIPNSNLVSFIYKPGGKNWQIRSLNPKTGQTRLLANTIKGVEDICWLDDRTLLSSKGSSLYKLTLKKDNNWKKLNDLSKYGITKITRLTTNITKDKLLIAGDVSEVVKVDPSLKENKVEHTKHTKNSNTFESTVQKQLDAYNAKDVEGFLAQFSEDIKLYNYPNELLSEGKDQMRKDYISWFNRTPDLKAVLKDRILIGNKVIDKEEVNANGRVFSTVAIYEVVNGIITKVTFMQ
ncbi:nuclear transport factor 2 family protein [uncultured Winogradskyella sp.]|uniref:nuclear transport factor 2 family protein n=1 Tax=uncultured Winogradskyella sp. TaxID=395353 RepID=UPI0026229535|nr:nuclear transport factor 2 family protein [uncultured Winogradskyella sp.]